MEICSLNVQGFLRPEKRTKLFQFFHEKHPHAVIALQETHSKPECEDQWRTEWGERNVLGQIVFCHGRATGTAILVPNNCDVVDESHSNDGRIAIATIKRDDQSATIVSAYAPSNNDRAKCEFFREKLPNAFTRHPNLNTESDLVILCGDMNTKLSALDTSNENFRTNSAAKWLQRFINDSEFVDVWREQHKTLQNFTWSRSNPKQASRIDYILMSQTHFQHRYKYITSDIISDLPEYKFSGVVRKASDHNMVQLAIQNIVPPTCHPAGSFQ